MKDLRHLALNFHAGSAPLQIGRRSADIRVPIQSRPINGKVHNCRFLFIRLRRLDKTEYFTSRSDVPDEYRDLPVVIGEVLPVFLEHDVNSPDDVTVNHISGLVATGKKVTYGKTRVKWIDHLLSSKTKGGMYGFTGFHDYIGVFTSMKEFYASLKHVYQDL